MDVYRSYLIAFMPHFNPPFHCHDWINLQSLCLFRQQFNLRSVLDVTNDVENQLLSIFLF